MKRIGVIGLVVAIVLLMGAATPVIAQANGVGPNVTGHGHLVAKITIEEPGKGPPAHSLPHQVSSFQHTGALGNSLVSEAQLWAIIIGISDYVGGANDLRYADDDAAEVRNVLIERYGYPADHIIMLLGDKDRSNYNFLSRLATRDKILAAISEIADKEKAGDEVVFYFSGHGGYSDADVDGDGEIIDEGIYVQDGRFIWDGELRDAFSSFNTSRIVFGFDSCMAGGMTDLAASGRIVAMASTETGYSYELGGRIRSGEFTYWFANDGMYDGRADYVDNVLGRADVTVEEAWDWANANCVYDTPTIDDKFTDDLLLGYYGAAPPPPPPTGGNMHVDSITFSSKSAGPNLFLYTTVKVVDDATGLGVTGSTVEMTLVRTGGSSWSFAGSTDGNGEVKFALAKAATGVYTATVENGTYPNYNCSGLPFSGSCTLNSNGTITP
jgi:hypothetical protein